MAKRLLWRYLMVGVNLTLVLVDWTAAESFAHSSNVCPKNNIAVQSTPGGTPVCRPCPTCPEGMGLSIKCDGQMVGNVEIECLHCKRGENYSPKNDYSLCIPCKKCDGQEIRGNCTEKRDNQKCIPCERAWFFDKDSKKCLRCSNCQNITRAARKKCINDGFHVDTYCAANVQTGQVLPTEATTDHTHTRQKYLGVEGIVIGIICGVVFSAFMIYACLVGVHLRKFQNSMRRSPNGREWISLFLCCPYYDRVANSGPPILTGNEHEMIEIPEDGASHVEPSSEEPLSTRPTRGDGNPLANRRTQEYCLIRNEEHVGGSQTATSQTECMVENVKVLELNAEVCRKMYSLLNTNVELGINYTTLGGFMGYSAQKVNEFASTRNPSKSLVEHWSQTSTNNVLKLIQHLKDMGRDDIVDMLRKELEKYNCHCAKCQPL